jgi:hypothetical protein
MIKLIDILKEAILTKHYKDRKLERGKILDIILPSESYEGYKLEDVKEKLIPVITKQLDSKLEILEKADINSSFRNIVIMKVYSPILKNKNKLYKITIRTQYSAGKTGETKDNYGSLYFSPVRNNELISLILTNETNNSELIDVTDKHLKNRGESVDREIIVLSLADWESIIDIDTLFTTTKKFEKQLIDKESLPYKVRADYRIGANFTHNIYGTGKIVATSSGSGGKADSRGMLAWIKVDFGKPFLSKGKLETVREFSNIYAESYFNIPDIGSDIILEYNIITIPESELNKASQIYDTIIGKKDKYKKTLDLIKANGGIYKPKGKLYNFEVTNVVDKTKVKVPLVLYNDEKSSALGEYDPKDNRMYVNLKSISPTKGDFLRTIEHELIHARDYFTVNKDAFKSEIEKLGGIPKDPEKQTPEDIKKYISSKIEQQPTMGPLINLINRNLNKFKSKKAYVTLLNKFLYDLRSGKSPEALINTPKYDIIPFLFTTEEFDPLNLPDDAEYIDSKILSDFAREMEVIKIYLQNPEIYKQFINRLFKALV